ncbi:MAG: glycosyltransferase family 2 protein [Paludibacteraceae bacterium]|nr:glycosyltransferase family 2 protein [Paludibacteraceae bacterium]
MLSVLICTFNREQYLPRLFTSIVANSLPYTEYELVVVDNNSSDHTAQYCRQFASEHKDLNFCYVFEPVQGLSVARNTAIRSSYGEVVVFVDDDAYVDSDYLATYANYFSNHPNTMAAGGPILPSYDTEEPAWMTKYTKELLTAYMYLGDKTRIYPKGRFPGGGNAAYRREVFDTVGLFNTTLGRNGNSLGSSEEKDIFFKLRQKKMEVVYLPKAILHHIIPAYKLENNYFDKVTYHIGRSERERTLAISGGVYKKRLFSEVVKWGGTLVLLCSYTLMLSPKKGWKLVLFRYNVTKGLLGR